MDLKSAYDFASLAGVIGCTPKQLGYYLHKRSLSTQYKSFKIPKKSGGFRTISAPSTNLKLIQKGLAKHLSEIRLFKPCVNGFVLERNIRRNASVHVGQRFILNIDIEDFFGSINFGRVYGMLLKPPYSLAQPVAAAIAKAATLNDKLPQGAPTSPVLSNLICAKMDAELTRFALSNRCKYSRYADDITFSTTRPFMPLASIVPDADGNPTCKLNDSLRAIIELNGFSINEKKVRLRDATARQEVTGLIVNKRVNTKRIYIREVRALLHAWRKFGLAAAAATHVNEYGGKNDFESVVRGRIEFIGHIRGRPDLLFRKLADQFNALTTGGKIRTILTADEIARSATWVFESDDEQGTAFFLEDFGLITCAHCVGSNPHIWHPNFPTKKYKVALLKEDKHRDLAVLEAPKDLNAQKLKLHTSTNMKDGSDITLLGYPNHSPGHNIRVEQGKVVRSVTRSLVSHYEISPKIIGGNSGGPVIANNNDVVGIAVRGLSGSVTFSTAEFFAINANELRLWLKGL